MKAFRSMVLFTAVFSCAALGSQPFKVGYADSVEKLRGDRCAIEKITYRDSVYLDAAKDESESFQLVIVPQGTDINGLEVEFNAPELAGNKLNVKWHIVGYVQTGNPSYPTEYVGLWPDPLMPPDLVDVAADKVQPLWFSVITSPDTPSGVYEGSVGLTVNGKTQTIALQVRVRDFVIPRPGTLATPFGLYRWTIEEWYYGERDTLSREDFMRWCRFLADYRLTVKNIGYEYVDKEYDETCKPKKLNSVDMSALNPGLKELSNEYFAPYSYGLYRLPSGPTVEKGLEANASWCTPANLAAPVKKYFDEWKRQGFNDAVYIYGVDEAVGDHVHELLSKAYSQIKRDVPSAKIMQTGNCNKQELVGLVDIWCPKNAIAWKPFFKDRLAEGNTLWMYVCCSPVPPYPNLLVDEPGLNHRVLFWQTRQINATGFLYWSTLWHGGIEAKPYTDMPSFPETTWDYRQTKVFNDVWVHTNGDGLLVYPGKDLQPLPSIRLEIVRDGIEDYEYMVLLEKLVARVGELPKYQTKGTASLIRRAEELSKVPEYISKTALEYTKDPEDIASRRRDIANMIEQLQDILRSKDYENWKM